MLYHSFLPIKPIRRVATREALRSHWPIAAPLNRQATKASRSSPPNLQFVVEDNPPSANADTPSFVIADCAKGFRLAEIKRFVATPLPHTSEALWGPHAGGAMPLKSALASRVA